MLSLESPRLAGYILTKNRSMFLETNGNVAWLYHCPKFYSPLQLTDECYNRIPIMYKENIRFVDPITRQTFQSADLQDCSDKHSNLFQLDVDDDKSWIELTPQITRVTGPYLFEPKEIIQKIKHSLASSQGASIYTYAQMQKFWNMISDNSEMKGILQKVSRSFLNAKKIHETEKIPGAEKAYPQFKNKKSTTYRLVGRKIVRNLSFYLNIYSFALYSYVV